MNSGVNNNPKEHSNLPEIQSSGIQLLGKQMAALDNVLRERDPGYWVSQGFIYRNEGKIEASWDCSARALLISPNFGNARLLSAILDSDRMSMGEEQYIDLIFWFTSDHVVNFLVQKDPLNTHINWEWLKERFYDEYENLEYYIESCKNNGTELLAYAICFYMVGRIQECPLRDDVPEKLIMHCGDADANTQFGFCLLIALLYMDSSWNEFGGSCYAKKAFLHFTKASCIKPSSAAVNYFKAVNGIDVRNSIIKILEVAVGITEADLFFHVCTRLPYDDKDHIYADNNIDGPSSWLAAYSDALFLNKNDTIRVSAILLRQAKLNYYMGFFDEALCNMNELKLNNYTFNDNDYIFLGRINSNLGHTADAINAFSFIIKSDTYIIKSYEELKALKYRAEIYKQIGQYDKAESDRIRLVKECKRLGYDFLVRD